MDLAGNEKKYTPQWAGALACLEQPVFFVRNRKAVYQNKAADRLLCGAPLSLEEALAEESMDCYRAFTGEGTMFLTAQMAGLPFGVTLTRENGYDVFVAGASPMDNKGYSGIVERAARSVRDILVELLDVSSAISPIADDPSYRRELEQLNRSICRLTRIAGNMSDYEALLSGRRKPGFQRVELVGELRDQCERIAELTAKTGVRVTFSCPERTITAAVDRELIGQALLNLVTNAMRASHARKIDILLMRKGHHFLIEVKDDGEGMETYDFASAFSTERFLSPLDDPSHGVGLGLFLAYQVARLHQGTFVLHSTPGVGTSAVLSFSLRLRAASRDVMNAPITLQGLDPFLVALADVLPPDEFLDMV